MKTSLLYLDDSYLKEMDATIREVIPDGDGKFKILLDKTVFYAMGGGQPTDQGTLSSSDWKGEVYQVMMKDGELWHFVKAATAPKMGEAVHGEINWERRYKHMRLHSAGHIIDFALFLLGYSPKELSPLKGDHGKKPFILYQGTVEEDLKSLLQTKVDELIAKNLKFSWDFLPVETLQKQAIYLQPNLPTNKPLRALHLETVGTVADGGTQLHTTGEAGKVSVDTVEAKDGTTLITYSLPQ